MGIISGTQSKLIGAALATVGCYAYARATGTELPAEVGGAVAVLMVALVDILLASGPPIDIERGRAQGRAEVAAMIRDRAAAGRDVPLRDLAGEVDGRTLDHVGCYVPSPPSRSS